jgi:hypothetical protein
MVSDVAVVGMVSAIIGWLQPVKNISRNIMSSFFMPTL